jgi:hypothetical protein
LHCSQQSKQENRDGGYPKVDGCFWIVHGVKFFLFVSQQFFIRELVQAALPVEPMYGFLPDAGIPKI